MINSSYTTYYNIKNKRIGYLFQGRYKAILVDKDSYAQVLSRYIHLNPVQSRITSTPDEYLLSSYRYYLHPKNRPGFLRIELFLSCFNNKRDNGRKAFKEFVEEGLSRKIANPFKEVVAGLILGSQDFAHTIKYKYLDTKKKSLSRILHNSISSSITRIFFFFITFSTLLEIVLGKFRYKKRHNRVSSQLRV